MKMRILPYLLLLAAAIAILSCSPTKSTIKVYTSPEFGKEVTRTVTIMNLISGDLDYSQKVEIKEKLLREIKQRYKNVVFYDPEKYIDGDNEVEFYNLWNKYWKKYINTGKVDAVALFDASEYIKSNAIMQAEVVDVEKVYGEHRKKVGQTTAKLKVSLFSLKSGMLLWEANVSGTQKNAHSDQLIPSAFEAVNVAVTNLVDDFPFEK